MVDRTRGNRPDVEGLEQVLANYGVGMKLVGDGSDVLVLSKGQSAGTYELVWMSSPTLTAVARHDAGRSLLVAGDHIGARSADSLRSASIDFVDVSGNAHLNFGDVVVDVRGRKRDRAKALVRPVNRSPNLFSARRMQVMFALLAWPELSTATIREISHASGTSVGLTQSTLEGLRSSGYLVDRWPDRLDELKDLWVAAYPGSLLPKLSIRSLYGDVDHFDLDSCDYRVSGEGALPTRLRSTTLTLYVPEFDERVALRNRWRSDREPNIEIRTKFWSEPRWADTTPVHVAGLKLLAVPKLLIYSDLLATGDPRQREIANDLRRSDGL